ncbi:DUF4442 domain-containing protein [Mucilaginibacter terrenus]|nr:DUF4442 domain-containing protein [Mucilaginibacter terrenus]
MYPPLLFQRIWTIGFLPDFKGVRVKVNKSLLNKNYNGSIFGGTIFAAADPFFPVLFHQILNSDRKRNLKVWSKSAKIDFLKPAFTDLHFEISIDDKAIQEAKETLIVMGKYEQFFPIDFYNNSGELCVSVLVQVYVRDLDLSKTLI